MSDTNRATTSQRDAGAATNLKSSRYFWGLIFVVVTVIGFSYRSVSEGSFGFLWTIAFWATLIFTFKPHLAKKVPAFFSELRRFATSSKKHLLAFKKFFGKTLGVFFVVIVGYLVIQWIMSSAGSVGSDPLNHKVADDHYKKYTKCLAEE